ncbi:MAG: hypothetical protein HZA02_04595 [Nitrospinae bacterium]|nr:hypothetical protein [Nitrospinota bacterium]
MAIAVNPNEKIRYILKGDRDLPVERQTVFLLKPLRAKDAARMQDGAAEIDIGKGRADSTMRIMSGTQTLEALRSGLAGWENFKNAQGEEVVWRENNGEPRPEMFDLIAAKDRRELAERIIEGRDLPDESAKN